MVHFEKNSEVGGVLSSGQGSREAELTGSNRPASYAQVLTRAQQFDAERIWASKTAAGLGVVSPQYLVRQNEQAKVGRFYNFPARSIATANYRPSTAAIR